MESERVIGRYTGVEKGPLMIAIAAMHGNEPAGVEALKLMFEMLKVEPDLNPQFQFRGRLLGLIGNTRAQKIGERFVVKDLNRQWTKENVARIKSSPIDQLDSEDLEIKEILELLAEEISTYQPERVVVLDLHTTTAYGGIFSIPSDEFESIRIALELHAPVVKGMLNGIRGSSLHFFNKENLGVDTVTVCFESGQHLEPLSIKRAIAAITNCMRTIGCVEAKHIENQHDSLLIEHSRNLPKLTELIEIHSIDPGDGFEMLPNFKNFQKIKKGESLAKDKNGIIYAPIDGLILMPLYQKRGGDGFFLIKRIKGF